MTQHPSLPAGPRAGVGAACAPAPARPPHPHPSAETRILSLLVQVLARWLGVRVPEAARHPSLAPLLVLWAALPTRRRTAATRAYQESDQDQAEAAAALRAVRRLLACIGWVIHGRRNRGMRPSPTRPHAPIRQTHDPPVAA